MKHFNDYHALARQILELVGGPSNVISVNHCQTRLRFVLRNEALADTEALQQLDGNVIGPKILGESTGLSSLWVIIAILVGGSFFGVAGMFFGVPVCACLYSLVAFLVDRRLAEKDLPVETEHYTAPLPEQETEPEKPEKTLENL